MKDASYAASFNEQVYCFSAINFSFSTYQPLNHFQSNWIQKKIQWTTFNQTGWWKQIIGYFVSGLKFRFKDYAVWCGNRRFCLGFHQFSQLCGRQFDKLWRIYSNAIILNLLFNEHYEKKFKEVSFFSLNNKFFCDWLFYDYIKIVSNRTFEYQNLVCSRQTRVKYVTLLHCYEKVVFHSSVCTVDDSIFSQFSARCCTEKRHFNSTFAKFQISSFCVIRNNFFQISTSKMKKHKQLISFFVTFA